MSQTETKKPEFTIASIAEHKMRGLNIFGDKTIHQKVVSDLQERINELSANIENVKQSGFNAEYAAKVIAHNQRAIDMAKRTIETATADFKQDWVNTINSICPFNDEPRRTEFISAAMNYAGF